MNVDELPLLSADSHVEEPHLLWHDGLPAAMRARAPRVLVPEESSAEDFGRRIGAGVSFKHEARSMNVDKTGGLDDAEVRLRTSDPEWRFKILREDGVAGEVIYPTSGLQVWAAEDAEVGAACCRIYNDWIHDRLESKSPRFRCAGLIPTWNVEDAVSEVKRIADLGLGAALLPLVGTPDWNHRQWEPLLSTIEEIGFPIVMHQGTGHDMLFYRGRGASVANLLATQSMAPRTAGLLATSGVLQDHPGLHFVFVECNASWLSWAMETLDHYSVAFQGYEGWVKPVLPEPPSAYLRRQIHGTFQVDSVAIANVPRTGVEPLLWGSDYPHMEGTYPNSRKTVADLFGGLTPEQAADIGHATTARLFGFEPEVLTSPV
ncbi:MAG: amidohydrolase family protein [Candidatus Binatia bacterium]|nr:amidohydrolase family protein [Candidatus Binatia bacterium]